jgi:glutamine synthetase
MDKDLYALPPEELKEVPTVAASLSEALSELDQNREFLKKGDVFTDDQIDSYIALKQADVDAINLAPHPVEFQMYYSS